MKIFDPYTALQAVEKQLLILNNYKKDIISLCLPSHSTHLLQSLNIFLFEPLVKAYKKSVENSSYFEGCYLIDKWDFLEHYL